MSNGAQVHTEPMKGCFSGSSSTESRCNGLGTALGYGECHSSSGLHPQTAERGLKIKKLQTSSLLSYNFPGSPIAGRFTSTCVLWFSGVGCPCIGSQQSCLQVTYHFGYPHPARMNGQCVFVLAYRRTWENPVTYT